MLGIVIALIALNLGLVQWARHTIRTSRIAEQRFIEETQDIVRASNEVIGQCCERLVRLEEWHRGSMIRTR